MQNIDLIAIGKMNAAYFAQGVAEYQKRLGGFCNFRIIELPEVQIADKNASDRQIAKALQKEGEAILASVRRGAYLVALCVESKQVSSEDLAAMIADRAMSGAGDMAFVIGSSRIGRGGSHIRKKMPRMEFSSPCGAVQLHINSAADPENPDTESRWRPSWWPRSCTCSA